MTTIQKSCAKEEVFVPIIKTGGIEETRILLDEATGAYIVSVKIKNNGKLLYLSTRRSPQTPRQFKSVDVAINVINKLIGAKKFVVVIC